MCIQSKTGERLGEPRLHLSYKHHTHELYTLRHWTNIVYIYIYIDRINLMLFKEVQIVHLTLLLEIQCR